MNPSPPSPLSCPTFAHVARLVLTCARLVPSQGRREALRIELKDFEHAFQEAHGRRPCPADVPAPLMAKYKEYNLLKAAATA